MSSRNRKSKRKSSHSTPRSMASDENSYVVDPAIPQEGAKELPGVTEVNSTEVHREEMSTSLPRLQQVVEAQENSSISNVLQIGSLVVHLPPVVMLLRIGIPAVLVFAAIVIYSDKGLWAGVLFVLTSIWVICCYLAYRQFSVSKERGVRHLTPSRAAILLSCYSLPILIVGWTGYNWCNITLCTSKISMAFVNQGAVWTAIIIVILALWAFYAYFQWARMLSGKASHVRSIRHKIVHRWVPTGLYTLSILAVAGTGYYWSTPKIIILVANFDRSDQKYHVTDIVLHRLRTTLAGYNNVEVVALDRLITEAEGSVTVRYEGNRRNASLVFWGWYEETPSTAPVSLHVEILCRLACNPQLGPEAQGAVRLQPVANLQDFTLHTDISVEIGYLSLFVVGMVQYTAGSWSEAIDILGEALEQTKEIVPAFDQTKIHYYRFLALVNLEDYDSARVEIDQVLRINPATAWALAYRALLHLNSLDYEKAIQDASEALLNQPDFATAYNIRGMAYMNQGKPDKALADLDYAIKLEPTNASFYLNRGILYSHIGDLDQAIAEFNRALQFDENEGEFYFNRGYSYFLKDDTEQAIRDLSRAIKLMPADPRPYFIRGMTYIKEAEYDRAISDLTYAIERRPDDGREYFPRAQAYLKKGKTDLAVADLRRYLELPASQKDLESKKQAEELLRTLEMNLRS